MPAPRHVHAFPPKWGGRLRRAPGPIPRLEACFTPHGGHPHHEGWWVILVFRSPHTRGRGGLINPIDAEPLWEENFTENVVKMTLLVPNAMGLIYTSVDR